MSSAWNDPGREPTPDPELEALARLYRDHSPPEPSERAWREALSRTEARLAPNRPRLLRWPLVVGFVAAALCGGVVLARALWTASPTGAGVAVVDEEPFVVASLRDIDIHRMDPSDAERIVVGQPLIGTMEFVFPEDVDLVQMDPDREGGRRPSVRRDVGLPMVVVARADADAAEDDEEEWDEE